VIAARRPRNDIPAGMQQVSVEELLNTSDVVTVHVDRINGIHVLGKPDIKHMKAGALLVNVAFPEAIEWEAVRQSILEGNIRAAYDAPPDGKWDDLPNSRFLAMPRQAAFDTLDSNNRIGDRIVDALLALLSGEASPTVVNPDYLSYRQSPNR